MTTFDPFPWEYLEDTLAQGFEAHWPTVLRMLKEEYKERYADILLHAVRADDVLCDLSIASKFDTDWNFLTHLRDLGREQAKIWVKNHYKDVNERSSVDIEKDYLNP